MEWNSAWPPLSLLYNGRPFSGSVATWEESHTSEDEVTTYRYRDSQTGLVMTVPVRRFSDFPAWEWVVEFENGGDSDTPILEQILPLDLALSSTKEQAVKLHWSKGSQCEMDDFQPMTQSLAPDDTFILAPVGGRSSDGVLPFMNLQYGDGGIVLAIGWTGQWSASFNRSQDAVRIRAGMERTHLRLHPGERIRTPRILLIHWTGSDPILGNNLLRKIILTHYTPEHNGKKVLPPVAHMTMSSYYSTKVVSEEGEMKAMARAAELGVEAHWIDACWYGKSIDWSGEVGTWTINPHHFPRGLK